MRFDFARVTYFASAFFTVFAVNFTASQSYAAKVGGAFETTGTTPLVQNKDSGIDTGVTFGLKLQSAFENSHAISLVQEYNWDVRASEKFEDSSDFADTALSYSFGKFSLSKNLAMAPSLVASLPISKLSRLQNETYGAYGASLGFAIDPAAFSSKNFELGFSVSLLRVFAKYSTDINGKVLNEYSSKQTASLAYHIGKATLSTVFIHRNGYSFQGTLKESFETAQEIGYEVSKSAAVAFGHTNSGSAFKDNGRDSNIALYSEAASQLYLQLALAF